MAVIPNFESILFAVHEALGHPADKKKQKTIDLRRPHKDHLRVMLGLLEDILCELRLDGYARLDSTFNIEEFADFHKTLEVKTWTFDADTRQVMWQLLACVYLTGLARHIAFWSLAAPLDKGMPGGKFWYLPHRKLPVAGEPLRPPVTAVLDWLQDLLGQPIHKAISGVPGDEVKVEDKVESFERTLRNWRNGDIPRRDNVERYFAEGVALEFEGCLTLKAQLATSESMDAVCRFLARKGLTPAELRHQIPMTQSGRIEAVLEGHADPDEQAHFIELLGKRYAQPSMRTIRQRLLIARAAQIGYEKARQLMCPETPMDCSDPRRNKVLQLIQIYQRIYNLTIKAAGTDGDVQSQDRWFQQQLSPWEKKEMYLAVLPSHRSDSAELLAQKLNRRFEKCKCGAELEDWCSEDTEGLELVIQRHVSNLQQEQDEMLMTKQLQMKLRSGSAWRALQATTSFAAIRHVAADVACPPRTRHLAVQRLRETAQTDAQILDAVILELDLCLNHVLIPEPDTAQEVVSGLLLEAAANPTHAQRCNQLLNAKAKHHLRMNDFAAARQCFAEALEACRSTGCGDLPGLIARDAFALDCATRPNGFNVANQEGKWRLMAAFNISGGSPLTLNDTANELKQYFFETLYVPYPGIDPVSL